MKKTNYTSGDEITIHNEKDFLATQYPMVEFKGETVKYDPEQMRMEKGELVYYLDFPDNGDFEDCGTVQKGIVTDIAFSKPWNYPVYEINGVGHHMYHRVWPIPESDITDLKKDKSFMAIVKESTLQNLSLLQLEALQS